MRQRRSGLAGARPSMLGHRIWGKRLGIVGMGRIGHRRGTPGARASACRSTITTGNRVHEELETELEATYWESLDQMLARMDIISVNCPHTPATYPPALEHGAVCKLLQPQAYIVNTSRGEVIDEAALIDAHGREGTRSPVAGLDVYRARAGGQPQAAAGRRTWSCCRTWARPRSKAGSPWGKRSSSTSGPSRMVTIRATGSLTQCFKLTPLQNNAIACAVLFGMGTISLFK